MAISKEQQREFERKIVTEGRKQGKSDDFIKQAVLRYREKLTQTSKPSMPGFDSGFAGGFLNREKAKQAQKQDIMPVQEKTIGQNIGDSIKTRGENIGKIFKKTYNREINPVETGIQSVGQGIGLVTDMIGSAVSPVFKKAGKAVSAITPDFIEDPVKEGASNAITPLVSGYLKFKDKNPRAAANVEALGNISTVLPLAKGASATGNVLKKATDSAKEGIRNTTKKSITSLKDGAEKVKGKLPLQKITDETEMLESKIAPKLTTREKRRAISEGRVLPGLESKIFGKTPDRVVVENKVKKAAQTLKREVPDVAQMPTSKIANIAENKIKGLSKQLKPTLESVKLNEQMLDDAVDYWLKLKKKQRDEVDFALQPTAFKKSQNLFENILERALVSKNLDDLWSLRKEYDDLIKDRIKNADDTAEAITQFRKDMWLDNRRILNDIINNASSNLDFGSKKLFDKMSDFYIARQNIINAGDIDLKGVEGLLSPKKLLKSTVGKATAGGLTFFGVGSLFD